MDLLEVACYLGIFFILVVLASITAVVGSGAIWIVRHLLGV